MRHLVHCVEVRLLVLLVLAGPGATHTTSWALRMPEVSSPTALKRRRIQTLRSSWRLSIRMEIEWLMIDGVQDSRGARFQGEFQLQRRVAQAISAKICVHTDSH